MIFNVGAAAQWLVNNALPSTTHFCAKFVYLAMKAGGLSLAGAPNWAYQCHSRGWLSSTGWGHIASIPSSQSQQWTNQNAQAGDIAVMAQPGKELTAPGHICMYTGSQWMSDFKQHNAWVYGGSGQLEIYRYGERDNVIGGCGFSKLIYDVPREKQEHHILMNEINNVQVNLLMEILESEGIIFDSIGNSAEDILQKDMFYYLTSNKGRIEKKYGGFYNKIKTDKKILSKINLKNSYNTNIYYKSEPLENIDKTVTETIVEKAIDWGMFPSIMGGDAAAAFGDLYNLAESQCERYLSGDKLARAREAVKYLMKFGLSKTAACASVAVFLSENGCTPNKVCNKEAEGKGSEYTKNGGYGAGIASWTGVEHKAKCLALLGLPASTKIETLSMEQQCKMYALELLSKTGNTTCNKILTGNLEEASVAAMFKTHGDYRPNTLGQYGYTYQAAYAEQLEHTPKLMRFAGVSTPSVYHQTALLTRVLLTPKLMNML